MGKVIRPFCWHENFVPLGLCAPALGLYTCIKSWKKLYKSDFKDIFLNLQLMNEAGLQKTDFLLVQTDF